MHLGMWARKILKGYEDRVDCISLDCVTNILYVVLPNGERIAILESCIPTPADDNSINKARWNIEKVLSR